MRVLHVASECAPWARTGGLGDVLGALPTAQQQVDPDVTAAAVMPLYPEARASVARAGLPLEDTGVEVTVQAGAPATVRFLRASPPGRAPTFFAACDAAFARDRLYGHADDGERFVLFSRAVVAAAARLLGGVDVLHAHDWHAALVPALVATTARAALPGTRTALTLHNLAFQGRLPADRLPLTGLPAEVLHPEVAEHFGLLSLLKAGIALADVVTTVSPTYAREILTPPFGEGLDGFLRRFRVHGILNGVDRTTWDPASDPHLPARYEAGDLGGKHVCSAELHAALGWEVRPGVPLLGVVGRMADQKGLDLVADLVPHLHALEARLLVLGSGEARLEDRFRWLAERFRDHLRVVIGFDEALSHRLIAGADALLVPSRFEPCGLTQLYALTYGTVPVVHATGGLADTVHDPGDAALARGEGTGFVFRHPTLDGLRWALGRAVGTFRDDHAAWRAIVRAGMTADFGWARAARAYVGLYREALAEARAG